MITPIEILRNIVILEFTLPTKRSKLSTVLSNSGRSTDTGCLRVEKVDEKVDLDIKMVGACGFEPQTPTVSR